MAQYTLLRGAKQLLTLRGPSGVRRGTALHDIGIIEDGSILIRDGVIAAVGPSRRVDNLRESREALEISANGFVVCPGFIDPDMSLSLEGRSSETQASRKPRKLSDLYNDTLGLMRSCLQHGTLTAAIKASADAAEIESDVAVLRQIWKIGRNPVETISTWRLHRFLGEASVEKFQNTLAILSQRGLVQAVEFAANDDNPIDEWLYRIAHEAGTTTNIAWSGTSYNRLRHLLTSSRPRAVSLSSNLGSNEAFVLADSAAIAVLSPGKEMGNLRDGSLRQIVDSGVAVALSSGYDSRCSPGFSMEVALSLAILRGGLSAEEAFAAATVNAAHALGCEESKGTLEVNKRADILVLTVRDYREIPREFGIGHVGMVIRDGSLVFNRDALESGLRVSNALIECVPNFSEGRNTATIDALESAITSVAGVTLLHRTSDSDHNRSVLTFAGEPTPVVEAAIRAARAAAQLIDLNKHRGVHPRLGSLDVLPFVPLRGVSLEDCVRFAHLAGERIWNELGIPVYFYEAAAKSPERTKLENVRRGQFEAVREMVLLEPRRAPDLGAPRLHPTAGAVIVGARKILIAFNINLKSTDLQLAQSIAKQIRSSNGGLLEVKALGLSLESRNLVQVSMNLTDFEVTPPHRVYREVERIATEHGVEIEESELIGLLPRKALEMAAVDSLKLANFESKRIIENGIKCDL